MARKYTQKEVEFLDYFRSIDKHAIEEILSEYHSTGPFGYTSSLMLSRILKVKERISSDRELSDKLAKNPIYRNAVGIRSNETPAHNTFNTLRRRLGPEGFARIHRHFVLQAHRIGLLTPPLKNLPEMLKDKIILIGDSTFLMAVASTKGEKDKEGNWFFSDDSIAFGRPHHKHKYPVGHRAHTVMSASGIPIASLIAPANESDKVHIMPVLRAGLARYPELPFGSVILDSIYDSEDLHRDIYVGLHLLPVIIRKPSIQYGRGFSAKGTPLCPYEYPTRRKGIEYNHERTKFACHHVCMKNPQRLLFKCPYKDSKSRFGWMTYTYFKESYRKQGPAVPGSRVYERLKPLRTGIRNNVFSIISTIDCPIRVDSLIAQKNKANPKFHKQPLEFFETLGEPLLKYAFNRAEWKDYEHVVVLFSSLFDKKKRGILKQAFKSLIKQHAKVPFALHFHDSKFDLCNQAADYFGWAIYRKWESNDSRPHALVQHLIKSEFNIFEKGDIEYYEYKK